MKETNWQTTLSVLGDVAYHAFTQIKLGDYAYIADLSKRGKVEIVFAKISDKARVETDEGDFHCAFETEKSYTLDREKFYDLLKNINIRSKTAETLLNEEQLKLIADVLSVNQAKRKPKPKTKR